MIFICSTDTSLSPARSSVTIPLLHPRNHDDVVNPPDSSETSLSSCLSSLKSTLSTWSPISISSSYSTTAFTITDDEEEMYSVFGLEPGTEILDVNRNFFHYKNGMLMVNVKSDIGDVWIPYRWVTRFCNLSQDLLDKLNCLYNNFIFGSFSVFEA